MRYRAGRRRPRCSANHTSSADRCATDAGSSAEMVEDTDWASAEQYASQTLTQMLYDEYAGAKGGGGGGPPRGGGGGILVCGNAGSGRSGGEIGCGVGPGPPGGDGHGPPGEGPGPPVGAPAHDCDTNVTVSTMSQYRRRQVATAAEKSAKGNSHRRATAIIPQNTAITALTRQRWSMCRLHRRRMKFVFRRRRPRL